MDANDLFRRTLRARLCPVPAPAALRHRIQGMLALEEVLDALRGEPPPPYGR